MRQPGRVFERASLMSAVWGYSSAAGERTVDVHVAALRAKLGGGEPDPDGPRRRVRGRASMTAVAIPTTPAGTARTSIAVRVTLVVIAVAVLVAAISAVVGILLVRRTLLDASAAALSDRADLIAAQLAAGPASADPALSTFAAVLAPQGIEARSDRAERRARRE